ncbi:MAG: class I SAM-dependent methyltransferase [Candidatus Omnitrophica bacterium]|nr:class I SAM-dependent methyltransferase [Candidatus Omnitrophota bacterium]
MTTACEICQAQQYRQLFSKDGYEFFRCVRCGHLTIRLELSDAELFRLYETSFFSNGSYADYRSDQAILQKNFARFINILRPYRPGGCLLDVGCAFGFFLDMARRHWKVHGIDVAGGATTFAREQLGLPVTCGELLTTPIEDATYDVVTMWDTIEHLRHPAGYVAQISKILKPGGVVALTTGDAGSLMARLQGPAWRLYDPPFHIHYFSRRTLTQLLSRNGLKALEIRYVGFSRSLNTMLHRLCSYRKPQVLQRLYGIAKTFGVVRHDVYVNLYDIMLVIAQKAVS